MCYVVKFELLVYMLFMVISLYMVDKYILLLFEILILSVPPEENILKCSVKETKSFLENLMIQCASIFLLSLLAVPSSQRWFY